MAVSRQPHRPQVRSLKEPVTKIRSNSPKHLRRSKKDDEKVIERINRKRRARGEDELPSDDRPVRILWWAEKK